MAEKTFAEWLGEHRNGGLALELEESLRLLVQAVSEHRKVGSLTLKITVRPTDVQSGIQIADDVKGVVPRATRQEAFYFADDEGVLHRNDPRQLVFGELREAPPLRVVNHDEGAPDGVE